jgi:SH3 domain-containing YSC84-like protein 1
MKTLSLCVLLGFLALPVMAVDRAGLDARISKLLVKFELMQDKPNRRIPPEILRNAQGIILLNHSKVGLVFGYQGGGGVAMARNPHTGEWSAPAFFSASESSFGFQIGGQHTFTVILLMNTNSMHLLTEPRFDWGTLANGTAGASSASTDSKASNTDPIEVVFTDTQGFYGGAAIKGASISPDTDANYAYYGQLLTAKEILFENKAKTSTNAATLIRRIVEFSKPKP